MIRAAAVAAAVLILVAAAFALAVKVLFELVNALGHSRGRRHR